MIKQLEVLRKTANIATIESGNGRLYHKDGTCTDIGGNTGGATRKALDGWKPPKPHDSDSDDDELDMADPKDMTAPKDKPAPKDMAAPKLNA